MHLFPIFASSHFINSSYFMLLLSVLLTSIIIMACTRVLKKIMNQSFSSSGILSAISKPLSLQKTLWVYRFTSWIQYSMRESLLMQSSLPSLKKPPTPPCPPILGAGKKGNSRMGGLIQSTNETVNFFFKELWILIALDIEANLNILLRIPIVIKYLKTISSSG